nr:putative aldo-keto reductase 1 [Quercus suber]
MDAALHNLHLDGFFIKEMMWHLSPASDSVSMFIHLQFQVFIFYQQPFNFNGTTKIKNLDANIGSFRVKLTKEDLKEISDVITINEVAGHRTIDVFIHCSWKFANTPEKESKLA